MSFSQHVAILFVAWLIAAMPVHVFWVQLRLLVMSSASLMAVGGYAYGISLTSGTAPLAAFGCAMCAGAIAGVGVALIKLRLEGHSFAIATFALQVAFQATVLFATSFTRGPLGLVGLTDESRLVSLACCISVTPIVIFHRFISGRGTWATSLRIVGRSTELATTLGVSPARSLVLAGIYQGGVLSGVGAFLASYTGVVEPNLYLVAQSMSLLAIAAFGRGRGFGGLAAGTALIVVTPETARLIGVTSSQAAHFQLALSGAVLCFAVWVERESPTHGGSE